MAWGFGHQGSNAVLFEQGFKTAKFGNKYDGGFIFNNDNSKMEKTENVMDIRYNAQPPYGEGKKYILTKLNDRVEEVSAKQLSAPS